MTETLAAAVTALTQPEGNVVAINPKKHQARDWLTQCREHLALVRYGQRSPSVLAVDRCPLSSGSMMSTAGRRRRSATGRCSSSSPNSRGRRWKSSPAAMRAPCSMSTRSVVVASASFCWSATSSTSSATRPSPSSSRWRNMGTLFFYISSSSGKSTLMLT